MVSQGDLGVRDDAGKQKGVCGIAEAALHPADFEGDLPQSCLDRTGITSVSYQTAGTAAGAFQLAVLNGIHGGIIKIL